MTSNSLSIDRRSHLANSLKSYWWLMLINTILFFLTGPVVFTMAMNGYEKDQYYLQRINDWFHLEGFYAFYVLILVLGVIMGLVMYNYLHHKRQINFYHSLPITRGQLFAERLGLGAVVTFLPLIVIFIVMVILAAVYGGGVGYALQATLGHFGRLLLFFFLSYSLTVLAGQLTGNVLTHIFMTLFLHFGLLLLDGCLILLRTTFFNTFFTSNQMQEQLFMLSPFSYVLNFLDRYGSYNAADPLVHMTLGGLFGVLLISIGAVVLAYILYLKRPSEASGLPVIFAWLRQPLKWVVMFIAATVGAYAFLQVGGKGFMIFGLLLFIALTQMTAEVIYNKDFKAIGRNLKSTLVFAVLFLALIGSLYYDVWGYDRYVPPAKDVQSVQIGFSNMAEGYPSYDFEKMLPLKEPAQIESVVALLDKVTASEAYDKNVALYGRTSETLSEVSSTIYVRYTMQNGREITRWYSGTPVALYEEEFARLYNSEEFKNAFYLNQLAPFYLDQLATTEWTALEITPVSTAFYDPYKDEYAFREELVEKKNGYSQAILEAVCQDIEARDWSSLKRGALFTVLFELKDSTRDRYQNVNIAVYAEDVHTLAVIKELQEAHKLTYLTPMDIAERIDHLEIFRLDDEKVAIEEKGRDVRDLRYMGEVVYDERLGDKLAVLTDPADIAAVLPDMVDQRQLIGSSAFVAVDYHYVAVAYLKNPPQTNDKNVSEEAEPVVLYFLQDHLPE